MEKEIYPMNMINDIKLTFELEDVVPTSTYFACVELELRFHPLIKCSW